MRAGNNEGAVVREKLHQNSPSRTDSKMKRCSSVADSRFYVRSV